MIGQLAVPFLCLGCWWWVLVGLSRTVWSFSYALALTEMGKDRGENVLPSADTGIAIGLCWCGCAIQEVLNYLGAAALSVQW